MIHNKAPNKEEHRTTRHSSNQEDIAKTAGTLKLLTSNFAHHTLETWLGESFNEKRIKISFSVKKRKKGVMEFGV